MRLPVDLRLFVLGLALAGILFVFDLMAAPHVAAAVAYVGLLLLSLSSTWPPFAYWLAALATALIVIGHLAAAADHPPAADLANRGLALAVLWLTAFVCARRAYAAKQLEDARAELQRQNDGVAATADRAVQALPSGNNDRKRIEEALGETEQRYRAVFKQIFQFAAVLDPHGAVEEVNETLRALGLPSEDPSGTPVWGLPLWDLPLWANEDRERLREAVTAAATGNFVRDEFRVEQSGRDDFFVDLSLKPLRDSTGRIDLIILEARDITQHKRDQLLLIQTQKMEVLGRFASGIAHDFNNLLTVIAGNLELVERHLESDDRAAKRIEKAVNAVFQGRSLTDRILTFARKKQLEPQPVEVKALVAEAIGLSRSALDENTAIESEIALDLWPCWADPAQLQTALLNLLINARDAMPNGGVITVRATNARTRSRGAERQPDLPEGDYVVLSVNDQGDGIPAAILDQVTDPFFTTKEAGTGSGLGLSMVAGFTKQSDGDLVIESTEGLGTTVSLYLPRSSQQPVASAVESLETSVSRGEGRLLVVEDDPNVRDAAVSMLSDLGYEVTEAADGEEAIRLLRRGTTIDLLLTDIMMPGDKDGRDLGRLARSVLPELAVLYSSGNPEMAVEVPAIEDVREAFISKPYHYAELAQKIEGLLSREDESE